MYLEMLMRKEVRGEALGAEVYCCSVAAVRNRPCSLLKRCNLRKQIHSCKQKSIIMNIFSIGGPRAVPNVSAS
jgi:hypothetical protein